MELAKIYLIIAMAYWINFSSARENGRLFYYETMSKISETTRAKRSSPPSPRLVKELHFRAFRRDFHLLLTSGSSVLAEGFQARMIHGDGSSTRFTVDQSKLFNGRVVHSKQSMVSAFLEGELWNIHIFEQGEAFAVEPAWRLLARVDNPHNDTMVTYRLSDVKDLPHSYRFCGVPSDLNNTDRSKSPAEKKKRGVRSEYVNGQGSRPSRHKRNARNTCLVHLVGDTKFFETRCQRSHLICSSMMINFLADTDKLFQASRFEDNNGKIHTGFGLQVDQLNIYTDYINGQDPSLGRHFNDRYEYSADQKLTAFAAYMSQTEKNVCIHHLFSDFASPQGILGRTNVATICKFQYKRERQRAVNTGISSGTDAAGSLLPSLLSRLVFSHEIGHNFGANHDPHTRECGPKDEDGGKFIMWSTAVDGRLDNNNKFSKCSLREIGLHVPGSCFVKRSKLSQFCGDYVVQGDEECDAGPPGTIIGVHGKKIENKCCTSDCMLREGANCSDLNQECCENCQIAKKGTVCRILGYTYTCTEHSYCGGDTRDCPEGKIKPDNESCGPQHVCSGGECIGPCEQETKRINNGTILKPCRCFRNSSQLCMYCCFDSTRETESGACRPIIQQYKPDGSRCQGGICKGGYCDQTPVESMAILGTYLLQIVDDTPFQKLIRTNFVMVVIVLSLVLWMPPSFVLSYLDKQEAVEREWRLAQEVHRMKVEEFTRRDAVKTWLQFNTMPGVRHVNHVTHSVPQSWAGSDNLPFSSFTVSEA